MSPLERLYRRLLIDIEPDIILRPLIVCGGRDFNDRGLLYTILTELWSEWKEHYPPNEHILIIHGGARGADRLAGQWAKDMGVPCVGHPADWDKHGKKAGVLRNIEMFDKYRPGAVIAFKGGRGTAHMVSYSRKNGANVLEI